MEPRLFSHGNLLGVVCYMRSIVQLQWSHDFSVMETLSSFSVFVLLPLASMEPRLFSHGNYNVYNVIPFRYELASMEPRLFSHGNRDNPLNSDTYF